MSRFTRSIRDILPPPWVAWCALLTTFGSRALLEFLAWYWQPVDAEWTFSVWRVVFSLESQGNQRAFAFVPAFAAALYGIWRAVGRHPVARPGYRDWLTRSPWRWPDPLPLGPVLPVWQDGLMLAVLSIPAINHPFLPVYIPAFVATLAYAITALLISLDRSAGAAFFVGLWSIALGVSFRETPAAVLACLLVTTAAAWRATTDVLRSLSANDRCLSTGGWTIPPAMNEHGRLGGPYDTLVPFPLSKRTPFSRLALALTAGLLIAAIRSQPNPPSETVPFFIGVAALGLAALRTAMYSFLGLPKLTLTRRFRFGRLLALRSDALGLSALAILLTGLALPFAVDSLTISTVNQIALSVAILAALTMFIPPSPEAWRLTSDSFMLTQLGRSIARQSRSRQPFATWSR